MLVENSGGGGGGGGGGGSNGNSEGKSPTTSSSGSSTSSKTGSGVSKITSGGGGGVSSRQISSSSRSPTTNGTTSPSSSTVRNTNGTTATGNTSNSSGKNANVLSTPTRSSSSNCFSTPNRTTNGTSLSRPGHYTSRTSIVNGSSTPRSVNGTPSRAPVTPIRTTSTSHTNRSTTSSNSGGGSKTATPTKSASSDLDNQLSYTPPHVLIRSISSLSQHSLRPSTPELDQEDGVVSVPALRKGVLLQARDRLFSRWKERYFVLTRDYLACFRRGSTKYSEMGSFIFKVNLASVETVEWQDRRGGPALALSLPREGRVLLRAKSGLDQWYRLLLEATNSSRLRRNALRRGTSTTHLNHTTNNNLDTTPPAKTGGLQYSLSGSTPEITRLCESVCDDSPGGNSRILTRHHRFSLLADVDLGSCDTDLATPPSSVTSSNKFSTSTSASNTSGSGGSSSLASSPSLRGSAWRPSSPLRPHIGDAPRSRLSLYEGTREMPTSAKTRHSVCLESGGQIQDIGRKKNRHSICVEPRDLARTRASLCLEPRNPLLDLMESVEAIPSLLSHEDTRPLAMPRTSPSKSEGDRRSTNDVPLTVSEVDTSPCPEENSSRPRAHSTSLTPERSLGPRSRSNLGFFRHSGLYNH